MSENIIQNINKFKEYLKDNLDQERKNGTKGIEDREYFLGKYPLSAFSNLTPEEYCLGTDDSKSSLSYFIEFGKIGFGIGGGSSRKHGVFYSKKMNSYMHGSQPIENIEEFWPKFRNEMYTFIVKSGESDQPLVLEDYPLLQGMAMVLTKYLSMYFNQKYIAMGSYSVLKDLMDYFGYDYLEDMRCHQLNCLLNKGIRRDFPELANEDGWILSDILWHFINGEEKKIHNKTKTQSKSSLGNDDIEETHYWIYSPGSNASKWDEYSASGLLGIGWGEIGDLAEYESRTDMQKAMQETLNPDKTYTMDSLATWQFAKEMKPGDIVYAKKGMYKIVGRGIVTSDYYYDENVDDNFKNLRSIDWKDIGEWPHPGQAVMKTLTDITAYTDYVEKLENLFIDTENEDLEDDKKIDWPPYSKEQFLNEVYMDEASYDTLIGLIKNKKNVILQGAPGVGKTFAANRIAYSMMGERNKDRVMMVQFHQSYSYEDFIEGFRPVSEGSGFEIKKGSFYKFCKKAADDFENDYFFIIDEINRGNLSKIFGELFMLIEKDKRGSSLQLLYSDEKFYVPDNVYIIGMMNTADRSLAMLDYALRRRFAFYEMKPAFDQEKFVEYRLRLDSSKFNRLIERVKDLNDAIKQDASLGEGFCVGHSYFCEIDEIDDNVLNSIVEYELIPLLKEYWFDAQSSVKDWSEKLRSAIK